MGEGRAERGTVSRGGEGSCDQDLKLLINKKKPGLVIPLHINAEITVLRHVRLANWKITNLCIIDTGK